MHIARLAFGEINYAAFGQKSIQVNSGFLWFPVLLILIVLSGNRSRKGEDKNRSEH
jgi:hypothetical protein